MRKDWGKLGAGFGFIGIIIALLGIITFIDVDESTRYFLVTCDMLLGLFVYFYYFDDDR